MLKAFLLKAGILIRVLQAFLLKAGILILGSHLDVTVSLMVFFQVCLALGHKTGLEASDAETRCVGKFNLS